MPTYSSCGTHTLCVCVGVSTNNPTLTVLNAEGLRQAEEQEKIFPSSRQTKYPDRTCMYQLLRDAVRRPRFFHRLSLFSEGVSGHVCHLTRRYHFPTRPTNGCQPTLFSSPIQLPHLLECALPCPHSSSTLIHLCYARAYNNTQRAA